MYLSRFAKKILLLGMLVLVSNIILLAFPLPYHNTLSIIIDKKKILQRATEDKKNKLIIIGGSSALVGFDGRIIQDKLNIFPVNMGVQAGFTLKFMFHLVEQYISPGDIVLLAPEYGAISAYSQIPDDPRKWSLVADPEFTLKNLYKFPQDVPILFCDVINLCQSKILGFSKSILQRKPCFSNGFLDLDIINEFGDASKDIFKPVSVEQLKTMNQDMFLKDTAFFGGINSFAAIVKGKGAKIYFSFPPLPLEKVKAAEALIDTFNHRMAAECVIPVLGRSIDFAFEYQCFTNSPDHLKDECRKIRTEKITDLIINSEQ